jgi:hypothetical protein
MRSRIASQLNCVAAAAINDGLLSEWANDPSLPMETE